jgi:hypothetical protein
VITRQLQAAKCSLSCQLFYHILYSHYWKICDFPTVVLNLNKRLLDLPALQWDHASFVQFPPVITKQLSDHSSNSSRIRTLIP